MKESKAVATKSVTDMVRGRIIGFKESGQLDIPKEYSVENALKSAFLKLQETTDKSGKPVLEACTKVSIANAILDMVVQGLNPAKAQCYFIAYSNKLICQRSYFGTMAILKRITDAVDVKAACVHEKDEFDFETSPSGIRILKHKQSLESLDSPVKAAYAIIEFAGNKTDKVELMTISQIKAAWSQSKLYSESNKNSVHSKFETEMCKKTVINRACRNYVNSSIDNDILASSFNKSTEIAEAMLEESLEEANTIDIEDAVDKETGEVLKPKKNKRPDEITEDDLKEAGYDIDADREAINRLNMDIPPSTDPEDFPQEKKSKEKRNAKGEFEW